MKLIDLSKILKFFNFKVNMSRFDYLEATATIAAEILVDLHKASFNLTCSSFQLSASAKRKFAEVKNV